MKKRSFISGVVSGLSTLFVSPVRSGSVSNQASLEKMEPYDAVNVVYGEFSPVEILGVREFNVVIQNTSECFKGLSFKLLLNPDDHHWHTWLVLEEARVTSPDFETLCRTLLVGKILSKQLYELNHKPCDEEQRVLQDYMDNSTQIVTATKNTTFKKTKQEYQTSSIYNHSTRTSPNPIQNLRVSILARFFELAKLSA